jgi:catecholate siderophore receptor
MSIASTMLAIGAGFGAQAQEAAEQSVPLPPLEVETQKSQPKARAKAKKAASSATVSPAPQSAAVPESAPVPLDPSSQAGLTPPSGNTNLSGTGLGRLPGTLQDTPQTVNVVPQKLIEEQRITTLDQALRNVPGITVAIGEGGGGMNGDQFRIRGLQAKGDVYLDGLRDFGVYVRDAFAYEQVEVIKGPSSESFGMGTTGGVINMQQKTAHLGNSTEVESSIGTGPYYRTTVDVNQQIDATTAARAVGMWHNQDLVDRDHIYSDRWGFLGSLAFGLTTDTTLTLNYLHQDGERRPDMGVPISTPPAALGGGLGRPVTEQPGVSRSNYYGKYTDLDDSAVDMLTARLSTKVAPGVTISNDSRLAFYDRYFSQTVTHCNDAAASAFAPAQTCATDLFDGDPNTVPVYGFGGPAGFVQDTWGAQNVTTLQAKFDTAGIRHEMVAGIDLFYQNDRRIGLANSLANAATAGNPYNGPNPPTSPPLKEPGSIYDPNFDTDNIVSKNYNSRKKAEAYNAAVFASDRVWLTKELSLLGGVRWDYYKATYEATDAAGTWTTDEEAVTRFWSPKASVIFEPTESETYYVSWARSFSPPGQFVGNDNNSITDPCTTAGDPGCAGYQIPDPEENELWEGGGKWLLLDGKLGLTAAVFRVDKSNQSYTDAVGDIRQTGDAIRVQGVELGASGQLTDALSVQVAYAYLEGEVRSGTNAGNDAPFIAHDNFSIWSTVEITKFVEIGPGKAFVGGGVTYSDEYFTNTANTAYIPSNFTFDAMAAYEFDGWRAAVNGYNLTDELNYDAGFGNRAVPAAGRTVLLTVGKKF